jgi:flagellar basal-body rod protein FlgC
MGLEHIFAGPQISASGLSAERKRMEVAAHNIANAHTTRADNGEPYRRQQIEFAAAMNHYGGSHGLGMRGVRVVGIQSDMSELPEIFDPGHPDANEDGYVQMPNVKIPHEMVDMMTASRAYEANLKSLQTFRQLAEQALSLLRGIS